MNRPPRPPPALLSVVLAAALLVSGYDLATFAATGDSLLLGHRNVANKATKVKRSTAGPVLDLKARRGSAPLKVNSGVKVGSLNADRVDGLDASALQTNVTTFHVTLDHDVSYFSSPRFDLARGSYLVNWSAELDVDTSGKMVCMIYNHGTGPTYVAGDKLDFGVSFVDLLSGSGVVDVTAPNQLEFFCNSDGTIKAMTGTQFIDVTFQRIDRQTQRTLQVP